MISVLATCYRAAMAWGVRICFFLSLVSGAACATLVPDSWDIQATCAGRLLLGEAKAQLLESIAARLYARLRHYNLVGPILDQATSAGIPQYATTFGAPLTPALYEAICPTVTLHVEFRGASNAATPPYLELFPRFRPARFTRLRSTDTRVMISYALDERGQSRGVANRSHLDALLRAERERRSASAYDAPRFGWVRAPERSLAAAARQQLPAATEALEASQASAWDVVTAGVWSDVSTEERTAALRILLAELLASVPAEPDLAESRRYGEQTKELQRFARRAVPLLRTGRWVPRVLGARGSLGFFLPEH